jgi:hypothetical protein
MRRQDIPARLRIARAADVAKIPDVALKAMAPADVAPRLLAADEYRRRAAVPHLDGDLYRHRLGLAREVLETADPKRAAELVKAAGVPEWAHRAFTGAHVHEHPDNGVRGSALHEHRHFHEGDASHKHDHPGAGPVPASPQDTGKSAKSSRSGVLGPLAKGAAPRSVTVPTPALDEVSRSRSLADGLTRLQRSGRLGEAAAELVRVAAAAASLAGASKAVEYRRKAAVVSDPEMRQGYLELAAQAERAGAR